MPSKTPTGRQLASWRAFLLAHHTIATVLEEELERETGLPLNWYDVLVHLHETDNDSVRMADLAKRVLISRSGLTRLVDRMEAAGLVMRRSSTNDARSLLVSMTESGLRTLRTAAPIHLRGVAVHFASLLSDQELNLIGSVMAKLAKQPPTLLRRESP
jgi:DNA-binding MarR family transcriptional regulator